MPEYDGTPAGDVRRASASGARALPNDPKKTAAAIIEAATEAPARLRAPLGVDTYHDVRASYVARLSELDDQRERALSVARADADVSPSAQ